VGKIQRGRTLQDQIPSAEFPVRVWGMDATGHPFFENISAGPRTDQEATLRGLTHNLNPGDVIGLQRADRKARFRVLWVMDGGPEKKIEAGIRLVEGQINPLVDLKIDPHITVTTGSNEKRKFLRHKISLPVEVQAEGDRGIRMHTGATDISGCGCYIESRLPLPRGTRLRVTFWIDSEKTSTDALVQASDPGVGMGIEFVSLDHAVQERLQAYLDRLEQEMNGPPAQSTNPTS
jgi:hypothetical protein